LSVIANCDPLKLGRFFTYSGVPILFWFPHFFCLPFHLAKLPFVFESRRHPVTKGFVMVLPNEMVFDGSVPLPRLFVGFCAAVFRRVPFSVTQGLIVLLFCRRARCSWPLSLLPRRPFPSFEPRSAASFPFRRSAPFRGSADQSSRFTLPNGAAPGHVGGTCSLDMADGPWF